MQISLEGSGFLIKTPKAVVAVGTDASADIVVPLQDATKAKGAVFDWPGEYEARGILVTVFSFAGGMVAKILAGGISICVTLRLSQPLSSSEEEQLGTTHVILMDGSFALLDAKRSKQLIESLEPGMVILSKGEDAFKQLGLPAAEAETSITLKGVPAGDRLDARQLS